MKTKNRLEPFIMIIFILICLVGVFYYSYEIIIWKINVDENNKIQNDIKDNLIVEINEEKTFEEEKEESKFAKYDIDFNSLIEQNSDTVAYVKLNNTNIDYVVVKGKDNDYYLKHNFEKKWNVAGWIFADYHNKFDESDKNIIIYGHNTKDGSMFGTLKKILNNDWYENEDNYNIVLVTENGTYYYQVFSTYTIKPEDYYINTEFKNNDEFDKFIKKLKSRSVYNYKVEVSGEDKILTLSSCIGDGTKRVVLHAKLIEIA